MTVYTPAVEDLPVRARGLVRKAQAASWTTRCLATDDGSERLLVSLRSDDRHLIGTWEGGSFRRGYVSASSAEDFTPVNLTELTARLGADPRRQYVEAMMLLSATMEATQPWEAVPV